jgi:hypothetical protein
VVLLTLGEGVSVGVAVSGIDVGVGGIGEGVDVGETDVTVGGIGVDVAVGRTGVSVGGTRVTVAVKASDRGTGAEAPHPAKKNRNITNPSISFNSLG